MVLGIVVLGFTATFLFIINSSSFDPADIGSRWASGMNSGAIGVRTLTGAGREKILKVFDVRSGQAPRSASEGASSMFDADREKSDPAALFVAKAIDGETLRLSNGRTVRLIGVAAPKAGEYFGGAAAAFVKEEIEGKTINLDFDTQAKDSQGRTLAYVHRRADNFFLNSEIIKRGFGFTDIGYPFEKREEFHALETQARSDRRGLWASS